MAGECQGIVNLCACQTSADCAPLDSANPCKGKLFCDKSSFPFACKLNPASVVTCKDLELGACIQNTCDPATGACKAGPGDDGMP